MPSAPLDALITMKRPRELIGIAIIATLLGLTAWLFVAWYAGRVRTDPPRLSP